MSIRWKLLLLLISIALIPLVFTTLLDRRAMQRLGHDLAGLTRDALVERSADQLRSQIRHRAAMARRAREMLEFALRSQARAIEQHLAADPQRGLPLYFGDRLDEGRDLPPDYGPSAEHLRVTAAGESVPIQVSYAAHVFELAPDATPEEVAGDIARLAPLAGAYRFIQGHLGRAVHWQFVGLESGVFSSYPAHGGYPPQFDHRRRDWYRNAKALNRLCWSAPYFDASSEQLTLTVAMPVRGPDGSFAGATGVDITMEAITRQMQEVSRWSTRAHAIMAMIESDPETGEEGALILAQPGYQQTGQSWNSRFEAEWLESDDREALEQVVDDMKHDRWGERELPFEGRESLWVYGPISDTGSYLLLVLPFDEVLAHARSVEQSVLMRTDALLRAVGAVAGVAVLVVLVCAVFGSRSVTRPVRKLAEMARRIARGDLEARADVSGSDEIGQLGAHFNAMVPQLKDRLRLRQSLGLAMEVQQHLLPSEPPRIEGLDVAGRSLYCDETGGDYYDYLDLSKLSPGLLGVAIGDVTGHGIAAALLMTTGRALLRSQANRPGGLAELMNDMNHYMAGDMGGGRFMTLFYGIFDTQAHVVRWGCAGHDPAILYDPKNDTFDELRNGDLPLGVDADWEYREHGPYPLATGQIVLLGTDGIWETRSPAGEFFGKDRLREVLRANAGADADELANAVLTAVAEFREDGPQEDDITLVIVRITET